MSVSAGPAVARQRSVTVDFGVIDPRVPATPAEVGVELFDGRVVTLDRTRVEVRASGNYTWYGRVRGLGRSDAVLTVVDGHIAGSIVAVDANAGSTTAYELISGPDGATWLRQIDPAGFPPEHPNGSEGLAAPPQGPGGALQSPQDTTAAPADSGATVDVMVVYSNQSAAAAGSGIVAQVQQAVDRANLAYANSNIVPRLRLVYSAQVAYNESGDFNTDLDNLTNNGDGVMDEVHAWRNTYGADLVSLFIENNAYCGLGWLNPGESHGFTVVNRGCAGGNLSFAHEVGHNYGAHHDPAVVSGPAPYPYGYGYVYTPAKWRTVMAYDNACAGVGGCTRIAYFSNPDIAYGSPAVPTGTVANNDNARVHDERANTVANFRQSVTVAAPTATTTAASAIGATGATLNGTVGSNGAATTVTFQYGLTTGYGSTATAAQSPLAANAANAAVSATVVGLACNTQYHFRVVGVNSVNTANGADLVFTTAACAAASTTTLGSNANPSANGTVVTFTATVTGTTPTGGVAFLDGGIAIGGCGAVALAGSGNTRSATCTTGALATGTHTIVASYAGNAGNAPSASAALAQQVVAALPITATVIANPYGTMSVTGGTLVGNQITLTNSTATIQLGTVAGGGGSQAQIDFNGLHVGPGNTLTIRSGAAGQFVVLRNVTSTASAIGGTLRAQGGNGAPPPGLYVWNPRGIAIAASGNVVSPSGLTLDALDVSYTVGQNLANAGRANGGTGLALFGANIRGGGAFVGDAIGVHTFGNANNPVNGADFLQNGLQLSTSSTPLLALTLNGFGAGKQVFNLKVNGDATVWMPSAWPTGASLPANNAVVAPGATRPAGAPEPPYGGGSMIVQATGNLTLRNGGTNDFVFPGAIVLKAGGSLDLNGVVVNQGWTTSGQSFQGLFFESNNIVSANGLIQVYGNDLNWMNFSTLPQQYVRAFSLKRNGDGSASFAATDAVTPHLNTYSVIQGVAAAGGCWGCVVNTAPVNMYGP
ncbi:MAG: M12 family metallo-peptidase [Burkholderiales bacterium]